MRKRPCAGCAGGLLGLLLLWLATAVLAQGRVLLMSSREWPVIQYLQQQLAAGGLGDPPLPPLKPEWVKVSSGAEAHAAITRLKPQLGQYRAIFTPSQTYARGAQLAGAQIPIVFDGVDDPVNLCLVDSLGRPGRNATGYMHLLPDAEGKMLQTLHDAFPKVREVVYLVSGPAIPPRSCAPDDAVWVASPDEPCRAGWRAADAYVQRRADVLPLQAQAKALGLQMRFMVLCSAADFGVLRQAARRPHSALLVPWQTLFDENVTSLVQTIDALRLPAIFPRHQYVRDGGLMSLEPVIEPIAERASVQALLQVLGGRLPAEMPVSTPRGFGLQVNAAAAHRAGLHPSLRVLRRADVVVQ